MNFKHAKSSCCGARVRRYGSRRRQRACSPSHWRIASRTRQPGSRRRRAGFSVGSRHEFVASTCRNKNPGAGRGREAVAPLGAPYRNRRLSCSLLWSWRVSGSQLSRRTVRAKSVRFASSAQAETGEAETQESERAGFGNGRAINPPARTCAARTPSNGSA